MSDITFKDIFFIGDLHLGHKNILKFTKNRQGSNIEEHDEWIIDQWNSVVTKRSIIWLLGDVAFGNEPLKKVERLKGVKHFIRGNHDLQSTGAYLKYFGNVHGMVKKYGFWLTHAPIHPQELRGKPNIHGHVHDATVLLESGEIDPRYVNVSVEAVGGKPISLDEIYQRFPDIRAKYNKDVDK